MYPPMKPTTGSTQAATLPPGGSPGDPALVDRVRRVIDAIRPAVQGDGGDIELVDVTGQGVVRVRFHGACVGCPSSAMTLKMGIERHLKQYVPEISQVLAVN